MDEIALLTAVLGLNTAIVGFVTSVVTTYRDLLSQKEKNPPPSQPEKDSKTNN
ncbi:hypothetical protein SAMN05216238_101235 [Lentibacillus persicus]|uniref:Uncharacterized protein n=1 Tax=Lentibacillus persicus TaxID=640948 RepID=A0A1I1SA56_9BACI|nr:hypothetical protein [Lentibacillus persicus]SFD41508.1 hypothetical protein SAMN05216238_101235 [Lentibacillus persicus]